MERQKRRRNLEVGKLRKAGPQWSQARALGHCVKFIQTASSIVNDLCKWMLYNDSYLMLHVLKHLMIALSRQI